MVLYSIQDESDNDFLVDQSLEENDVELEAMAADNDVEDQQLNESLIQFEDVDQTTSEDTSHLDITQWSSHSPVQLDGQLLESNTHTHICMLSLQFCIYRLTVSLDFVICFGNKVTSLCSC